MDYVAEELIEQDLLLELEKLERETERVRRHLVAIRRGREGSSSTRVEDLDEGISNLGGA